MSHEHMLAGVFGGLTSTLVLHPLDLLKIRFAVSDGQSQMKKTYKNIPSALVTIVKDEGFAGLYKGVTPNCLGSGAAWGLYFLFYNSIKKRMEDSSPNKALGSMEYMTAGACAGVLTTAITNPIWVVKTRMCLQYYSNSSNVPKEMILPETKRYSGTWDALTKVYKYEGVPGLYKGFGAGLFGVSHGAIQLTVYEKMKELYLERFNLPKDHNLGTLQYLTCAATSKLVAATLTFPYQVIRHRLQDQYVTYNGYVDVIRRTWVNESFRGFYKGFAPYVLHVTPNVCIVFLIYEGVLRYLK